jgi:hypothetical protein
VLVQWLSLQIQLVSAVKNRTNYYQKNRESRGGEGVFVEMSESLVALRRDADDSVSTKPLA